MNKTAQKWSAEGEKESIMDIFKLLPILPAYVILHSRDTIAHHIFVECLACAKGGRGKPCGYPQESVWGCEVTGMGGPRLVYRALLVLGSSGREIGSQQRVFKARQLDLT